jgi:hypothetical protein
MCSHIGRGQRPEHHRDQPLRHSGRLLIDRDDVKLRLLRKLADGSTLASLCPSLIGSLRRRPQAETHYRG